MPSVIPFGELDTRVHALTDASSLAELREHGSTLTSRLDPSLAQTLLSQVSEYDLEASLNLLERWIVVDRVVVDVVAVDSLNLSRSAVESFRYEPDELDRIAGRAPQLHRKAFVTHVTNKVLSDGLGVVADALDVSLTVIPPDIFEKCVDLLGRTSGAIHDAQPNVPWDSFGFGLEKRYGETLTKFYGTAGFLAHSHLGVVRTLVYYETAAAAGVPLILHPVRDHEIAAIGSACWDAYAAVRKLLRDVFQEEIARRLAEFGQPQALPIPPLVSKMIQAAGRKRTSIVDSAIEMKESKNARAFRRWLADIQTYLTQGTTSGALDGLRMLDELKRTAASWAAELDTEEGVTHRRRRFTLSWVPRIGALLDLLDRPTIRDPILNQKGYLAFVSSWFNARD